MPITTLKTAFSPEDTAAMTAAFEESLKRLKVADREAPIATSVAIDRGCHQFVSGHSRPDVTVCE